MFDEAHSPAAKAVEHFSVARCAGDRLLEGACNAVRDAVLGPWLDEQLIRDSRASAERIERRCAICTTDPRHQRFRGEARLPVQVRAVAGLVRGGWWAGPAAGEELQKTSLRSEYVLEKAPSVGTLATQVLSVLGFYVVRPDNRGHLAPDAGRTAGGCAADRALDRAA